MFLKKYFVAPLDVLYERLVSLPIIFLSLLVLFLHFSWQNLLILLLSIIGTFLWDNGYLVTKYNCQQYFDLMAYLDKYSQCNFEFYKLEDVLVKEFDIHNSLLDIFRTGWTGAVFNNQIKGLNLGYLCAVKRKNAGEICPYIPKSFLFIGNPSYIITTDAPDTMSAVQTFYIFHELGHLARNQELIREMYSRNKIHGLTLILLVGVITNLNITVIIIALVALLIWMVSGIIISNTYDRLELDADCFAIFALINHPQFGTMERLIRKVRSKNLKKETPEEIDYWFERSKEWALNQIKLTENPARNTLYNYNACTERLRITPLIIRLFMGVLIFSMALYSKPPNIWGFMIIFFAFVVVPLYLVIIYSRSENNLRSFVENKLNEAAQNKCQ